MSKHEELESKIGKDSVLVVNSAMEVKLTIPWQDAVTSLHGGKSFILLPRTDGSVLRSAHLTLEKPLVISLFRYVGRYDKVYGLNDEVGKNFIRQRDNFTCVYCGNYGDTVDHIFPKSRGGKNTWGNYATACQPCNGKKGNKTPEEAGLPVPKVVSGFVSSKRLAEVQALVYEAMAELTK